MKIFEPKPPPTSGEITRSLCSGNPSTKAAMIRRCTCGFCDVTQSVTSPVPGLALARAERGSMAFGMRRWLRKLCFTTFAAPANALSVAALSPSCQRKQTLSEASSWTAGAPRSSALAGSVTAGSGS